MDWIRSLVKQGKAAGVATFVKQLGSNPKELHEPFGEDRELSEVYLKDKKGGDISEFPKDLQVRQWPKGF